MKVTKSTNAPDNSGPTVQILGGKKFRAGDDALYTVFVDADGKEEKEKAILAGKVNVTRVQYLRDLDRDLNPGDSDGGSLHVEYTPPGMPEPTVADVSTDDLSRVRDHEFPRTTDMALYLIPRQTKQVIEGLITLGTQAPHMRAFSAVGPVRREDGQFVFLRQGGRPAIAADGFDAEYTAVLPDKNEGIEILDFADPSRPEQLADDFTEYMRMADGDLIPGQPYINAVIFGQLAYAPAASVPGFGRVPVILSGESGLGKSSLAMLPVAAQSSRNLYLKKGSEPFAQAKMRHKQSTTFGIDVATYPLNGTVALIDDLFAGKDLTAKDLRDQWVILSGIADNANTGSGGMRGNWRPGGRGGGLAVKRYPRTSPLMTAEILPSEESHVSEVGRLIALSLAEPVNRAALTSLQYAANTGALARAHSALIRRMLPDFSFTEEAMAWAESVTDEWAIGGHARSVNLYQRTLAGLRMASVFQGEILGFDGRELSESYVELVQEAGQFQSRRSGIQSGRDMSRDHVEMFIRHFRNALGGSDTSLYLADAEMSDDKKAYAEPLIPGSNPSAVGWKYGSLGYYPARSGAPVGAVLIHREGKGGRPPWCPIRAVIPTGEWPRIYDDVKTRVLNAEGFGLAGPSEMLARLVKSGYLQSEKPIGGQRIWGGRKDAYVFDLGRIIGCNPGDESGGGQAPEPEPSGGPAAAPESPEPPGPAWEAESLDAETAAPERPSRGRAAAARERTAIRGALALDSDGKAAIFRRGREPEPAQFPRNAWDAYSLAGLHGLTELWIHPAAMRKCGLPSVKTLGDYPMNRPVKHAWGNLIDSVSGENPGTIAATIALWTTDAGRDDSEKMIYIPAYDSRASWDRAADGQTLIDAVEIFAESLGSKGHGYQWSPNYTMAGITRRACPQMRELSTAVMHGKIPPVKHGPDWADCPGMLGMDWQRALNLSEQEFAGVAGFDRNAAELSGFETVLGVGNPEHLTGEGIRPDKKTAGYYRLARQPSGYDGALPPFTVRNHSADNGLWAMGPEAVLMDEIGILPPIMEAWVWPNSKRSLSPLYRIIREAREFLAPHKATDAGRIAWAVLSECWHPFIGNMSRNSGPKNDRDVLWRPDIRNLIQSEAYARMYRSLAKIREESGRAPVAAHADAVFYAANGPDDIPAGMRIDSLRTGSYKAEGYKPLSEIDMEHIARSVKE